MHQYNWKYEIRSIILIFLFGGIVQVLIWCSSCWDDTRLFLINMTYSGLFWVFLWKGSEYLVDLLNRYYSWLEHPIKRLFLSVFAVAFYTASVVLVLNFLVDLLVFQKSLEQSIKELADVPVVTTVIVTLAINAVMHGRAFLFEWRQSSIDMEKLKTEQVFTQFQSLKNQVNPHFLFNSLNALSSLVYDNQAKAVEFIRKLSEVYRYVLDQKDEEVVSIKEEVRFLSNFVFLQKIRFGENLQFEIEGEESEGFIPPLALQLLVENAIKHNVVSEQHPLSIKVTINEEHCVVKNNVKEKLDKDSTGIGLENLKARYGFICDREVVIEKSDNQFVVKIPVLKFRK